MSESTAPTTATPVPTSASNTEPVNTPATAAPAARKTIADAAIKKPETVAPKAEEKPEPKKYRFKTNVDGQEAEEEYSEDEIKTSIQLRKASQKRMQESAELRKKWEAAVDFIKKDPVAALKDEAFGVDVEALVEQRLVEKYRKALEDAELSPEQKAQRDYETKVKQAEERAAAAEKKYQSMEQAKLDEKVFTDTQKLFREVLSGAEMDDSFDNLYELASIARDFHKARIPLTAAHLSRELKERVEGSQTRLQKTILKGVKGERLIAHLGEDVAKEVVRAYLAKVQPSSVSTPPPPVAAPVAEEPKKPAKSMSPSQFRRKHLFGLE
jgi:hypothetical protein